MSRTGQWEQIEALFHAALEVNAEERESFLAHNCTNSDVLVEVKRLLAEDASSGGILDSSSSGFARLLGELAEPEPEASLVGSSIGPYKILQVLGQGGMGKVYLAEDTRLGRKVALKFLSSGHSSRSDGLRRFMTEARATSALNHPNIVTIHDIGREGGTSYIAVEYIEGETLRQRMRRPFTTIEALRIVVQVARALAAAHGSGVIHRDIKPENIMIRADGLVKVVDFGLAKLTRTDLFGAGLANNTTEAPSTIPGAVLGTLFYMSPEQANGQELDVRTDVFSLGVVLYEMLTGHKPFVGDSLAAFLDCLIRQDPDPISELTDDVEQHLQAIVNRAVAKDRDSRYGNAGELLQDLQRVLGEVETSGQGETSDVVRAPGPRPIKDSGQTGKRAAVQLEGVRERAGWFFSKRARALASLIGVLLLAAMGALAFRELTLKRVNPVPFADLKTEKITSSGDVETVAVSSVKHLVAYTTRDENGASLWVKQLPTGAERRIVGPEPIEVAGLTFSKDGAQIYYTARPLGRDPGVLYRAPVIGGSPIKVRDGVMSRISFSPDGKQFAFVRDDARELVIADTDRSGARVLATASSNEFWRDPAWSPDGRTIACGISAVQSDAQYLAAVGVATGSVSPMSQDQWIRVTGEAWLHDGSGLIMSAADRTSQIVQLWFISYPQGITRKMTNDAYDYRDVAVESSGSLLSVRSVSATDIWVMRPGEQNAPHRIPYPSRDSQIVHVAWTGDGRIVYSAGLRTTHDIWIMDSNGENQRQLTSGPGLKRFPCVSPDNKYIVFSSDSDGRAAIWRMNIDGSDQVQLSSGSSGFYWPQCTPDSRWVVYQSVNGFLWKIPIEGGQPVQLTTYPAKFPSPSPDGAQIACILDGQAPAIGLVPIDGGATNRTINLSIADTVYLSRWSAGQGITCLMGNNTKPLNVYRLAPDGGKPVQLTFFTDLQRVSSYGWSRDGQLVLSRTSDVRDVVQITGLGPS